MKPTAAPIAPSSSPELPPIDSELRSRLEDDILARGILVPIIVAEDGTILDGRVRAEIAARHRLAVPKIIVGRLSPRERDGLRVSLNTLRRHLTREQVRTLISWELRRTPMASDRAIAGRVGADHKTVAKVRGEAGGENPHLRVGRDGKKYPVPVVITTCEQQAREAARILSNLEDVPDGRVSVRRLRTLEYEENRKKAAEGPQGRLPASVTIRRGDFRRFDWRPWEGRAALVHCDPPWLDDYADLRKPLAELCGRLLRPGGIAAVYCGTYGLPAWIEAFSGVPELRYVWAIASVNRLDGKVRVHGRGRVPIQSSWRPILLYSRGDYYGRNVLYDLIESFGAEKSHHEWQQPLHEAVTLIDTFTTPGDDQIIIDPCCGSGTTLCGVVRAGGGRQGFGLDIDAQAVRIAKKRVSEAAVIAERA